MVAAARAHRSRSEHSLFSSEADIAKLVTYVLVPPKFLHLRQARLQMLTAGGAADIGLVASVEIDE